MTVQEILPPVPAAAADGEGEGARDKNGRFRPGGPSGNPNGRPAGSPNITTREIKEAIANAFNTVGGEDYLVMLAFTRPDLFCALVGRIVPPAKAEDDGIPNPIGLVRRIVVDPTPKK